MKVVISLITSLMAPLIKSIHLFLLLAVAQVQAQQWVLQNIRVVDVRQGRLIPGEQDIYISQGRILSIVKSGAPAAYTNFEKVNGVGKYVIPGLWDMHAHPDDPEVWRMQPVPEQRDLLLPLFVLNGVTGIRDMAGSLSEAQRWRSLGEEGKLLVPEIVACGPLLDGPNPMWDGSVGINDPVAVPQVVDSLMLAGADFLKVYSLLPREIYLTLAAYAVDNNIPMVGHVPLDVLPSEAAATGMSSQEHLLEILTECSSEYKNLRTGSINYGDLPPGIERYIFKQNLIMDTFDTVKFQGLIEVFLEHDTWITPTLSMWYKNAWYEQELTTDSLWLEYLPEYLRKYWTPEINDHLKYRDNLQFLQVKRRLYGFYQYLVGQLQSSGVNLLCGTDMGANPLCFPGIGVYNELEALVTCGLNPGQALQTATINPALFLGIEEDYGSVETGKAAELVILNGNPLDRISNTRNIWGVVQKGVLLDFQERSNQLEQIRATLR